MVKLASAEFNLREIVKQLILLEDHLTDPVKFCPDCIRKHLMHAEGLSEEAVMMEPKGWVKAWSALMVKKTKEWMIRFTDGADRFRLSQDVRKVRKDLMNRSYDPRIK